MNLLAREKKLRHMRTTQKRLLHPPPCRKGTEEERWFLLLTQTFFVWEQRQRPGSRFPIQRMTEKEKQRQRQTQKDTVKPSAPQNSFRGREGRDKSWRRGTNKVMKARRLSRKRWHISFAGRTPAYQSNAQYNVEAIFSFVLDAIVQKIIRNINHVDIS